MDALTQPGLPSAVKLTTDKNASVIIGAGTPTEWTVSYGGGLRLLGLESGELVGEDPRPIFEASGPAALRAWEDVVEGRRPLVKFRGTYPGADGRETRWDVTLSKNGQPGNWNFVGVIAADDEASATVDLGPDAPWYARLLHPVGAFLNGTPITKLIAYTLCAAFLYGTWAWWRPDGHWKDAMAAGREYLDVRRAEALARIEEARTRAGEPVQINVAPVAAGSTAVERLDVEADNVEVRSSPSQPRPPAP